MLNFKYIVAFMFLLFTSALPAQVDNDALLARASRAAQSANYAEAQTIVLQVLAVDSVRTDALVMMANLNFWSGENEKALLWIEKANIQQPRDDDFYSSYMNILIANKKFSELLLIAERAKNDVYRDALNLLQKRMIAYNELGKYEQTYEAYKSTDDKEVKQQPAIQGLVAIALEQLQKSALTIGYSIDMFSKNAGPQHLASVGYSYKPNRNTYGVGVNYANRFGLNDLQVETTNYLYVADRHYIYANFGMGLNYTLFPQHRIGLEYYFPISAKLESSVGGRYLHYYNVDNDPHNTEKRDVFIVTGHLGGYIGEGWLAFRPFWVIKKDMQSLSMSLKYRKYGKTVRDFWGVELLAGNSPDDMYSTTTESGFNELSSYKIRIEKSWRLNQSSDLLLAAAYGYEQFVVPGGSEFRSRLAIDVSYRIKF